MMRRLLSALSIMMLASICMLYAIEPKTLNAKLDLTSDEEISFYFASTDDHTSAIDALSLASNMSRLPVITGNGQFDIVWNAVSSKAFSLYVYSAVLKTTDGTTLDWTGKSSGNVILGKVNGYGGSDTNKVYTHDPSKAIGNSGYIRVDIETDDMTGKPFSEYTTTLKLELKTV